MKAAAVAAAATAALILVPCALGHGSVLPTLAEPGASERFTFQVLNARETAMVGFRLELPAGATVVDVPRKPGWLSVHIENVLWWRGSTSASGSESFTLDVRMPEREGTVTFTARELFTDGSGPPFYLDVVLAAGSSEDAGSRTALVLGIAGGVLLAAAALLVRRRRR